MVYLKLVPGGRTREFQDGTLLMDALQEMGVVLKTPCGGKGICGKCAIKADGLFSSRTDSEKKAIGNKNHTRLACQAGIFGNATVYIDESKSFKPKTYPKIDPNDRYGIAVDIGTTSVSLALINITRNMEVILDGFLNPQRRFGHDVISRIAAARDANSFTIMTRQIRQAVFSAIHHLIMGVNLAVSRIDKIIFSGNTTMLYLLYGMDVTPLGAYPFQSECIDFQNARDDYFGFDMLTHSRIFALPVKSAFLGADLMGGLTLSHVSGYRENTFFIDLGTNGEMFCFDSSGAIHATSCAMGPALEGMNMSSGMTADEGAITHIRLDSGTLAYTMIGKEPPAGLTGTAIIDLVAVFLSEGIILPSGVFAPDIALQRIPHPAWYEERQGLKQIRLWNDITFTQKDVRNLQLAKAASRTAASLLLQAAGSRAVDIRHVLIAGALGEHLDIPNFRQLGFIPNFCEASWRYMGNTSLKAAARACVDDQMMHTAVELRNRVREVNIARNPSFNREFISALDFKKLH